MSVKIRVEPQGGDLPSIVFKWDPETEILSGRFAVGDGRGLTGSVEYTGSDGAFALLDVERGTVCGIEVVVWPPVENNPNLTEPHDAEPSRLNVPARPSQPGIGSVEVENVITAEASGDERTIHLRVGSPREITTCRIADNFMVEIDEDGQAAGFWLLNVAPFPEAAA